MKVCAAPIHPAALAAVTKTIEDSDLLVAWTWSSEEVGRKQVPWNADVREDIGGIAGKGSMLHAARYRQIQPQPTGIDIDQFRNGVEHSLGAICTGLPQEFLVGGALPSSIMQGGQFCLSSWDAYRAWTDRNREQCIIPTMKTVEAAVDLLLFLQPFIPWLQNSPAGVLPTLSIGVKAATEVMMIVFSMEPKDLTHVPQNWQQRRVDLVQQGISHQFTPLSALPSPPSDSPSPNKAIAPLPTAVTPPSNSAN